MSSPDYKKLLDQLLHQDVILMVKNHANINLIIFLSWALQPPYLFIFVFSVALFVILVSSYL